MVVDISVKRNIYLTSVKMYNEGYGVDRIVRILHEKHKKELGAEFSKDLCNEWVYKSVYTYIMKVGV